MTWLRIRFCVIIISCTGTTPSVNSEPKEVVGFIYHRFRDSYPSTNTPVADFEAHLAYLRQHNYQVLNFRMLSIT